jgi:hypothetical protein
LPIYFEAARPVYNYAVQLEGEYKKAVADNNAMSDRYNALLLQANNLVEQQNARLARQQRVNNALAVYNAMPKYQPPQTVNVNVTDCTKLPALCIHRP